jgi:hypothetical protein
MQPEQANADEGISDAIVVASITRRAAFVIRDVVEKLILKNHPHKYTRK